MLLLILSRHAKAFYMEKRSRLQERRNHKTFSENQLLENEVESREKYKRKLWGEKLIIFLVFARNNRAKTTSYK